MLNNLSKYWWLFALRGVFSIIFGILAFVWPGITLGALVILFGVYALIDGVSTLVAAVSGRSENDRWWVMLLEGLVGVAAGVLTFLWPAITAMILLFLIAFWALFTGVLEIIAAIRLRKEIENEWVLGLIGVLSILFGIVMLVNPGAGALALIWVIGSYAILFGVLLLYLAYKVHGMSDSSTTLRTA